MARNMRWQDMSQRQKTTIIVAAVVQVALQSAALIDIRRRRPNQLRGSKRAWAAATFVNFLGPIAYFVYGRKG